VLPALLFLAAALPDADPVIRKPAAPSKFIESAGRHSFIVGREDGTFEAWLNPIKILRDFRLSVYFDGALEPTPLADLAETVHVSPGRVTILHAHAAFTIKQTWFAPLDRSSLAVLLEIDTAKPLKIRASFLPEFKPMWPASFGGQSSRWSASDHVFYFGEGLRKHTAVLGAPEFVRASEQIGHQLPDRTMLAEMDITPERAREGPIAIVLARSIEQYRDTRAQLDSLIAASDRYYRDFASRTLRIETPVPELNHAFEWARFAMEKGWACNDGVGCGLVAGYGPSGASERPGFAWYFGGDALINSWSIVDYGDFPRARTTLEFVRDHQRADGKMQHELTQSAALLDWSQYPYGYYHGETTPLFLFSAARYVAQSGDLDFLRKSWPAIEKAYRFCLGTLDADGLMSNRKAGMAAVETGALSGKVDKDVYLAGAWLAALDGFASMADLAQKPAEALDARARLAKARASLNQWFVAGRNMLAFGRLQDGSMYEAQSGWQSLALAYGGLDRKRAEAAAAALSRRELSTLWGIRLFATDSPYYDPLGYNDGSVWPFVTGFATMAEFRYHHAEAGLKRLTGIAAMTGLSGAGFLTENFSGDRPHPLPRSVPHQLFSSSAVLHPLVSGLLGLDGDGIKRTLRIAPHIPMSWKSTKFENYRVGESLVSGEITNEPGETRIRVEVRGPALDLTLAPAFPIGARLLGIKGNDVVPMAAPADTPDLHLPVGLRAVQSADVTWQVASPPSPAP
jgi:glycogen debranching enzyme